MCAHFTVAGNPVPQGSMSVYNGRVVHSKSKELMAWRNAIGETCRDVMEPLEGAVEVTVTFVLEKPKSVTRGLPHVKPDVDKLARAALDGLTGAAFADDSQVVRLTVSKVYGTPPRALFVVESANER